jgi:7-carboxy-7-deazaguanine synthase
MASLRLLEHYFSVQGEGPRVGIPTQFVRFAGCNFRCAGWPCDTPYAIEPNLYKKVQRLVSSDELANEISNMYQLTGARNICLTGGEPMVQNVTALEELIRELTTNGFDVEMFSNGSILYPPDIVPLIAIIMDWKLPGSGEFAITQGGRGDITFANIEQLRVYPFHTIKFTVADSIDLESALRLWEHAGLAYASSATFIGPVWGKIEPAEIVDFIRINRLPWRLTLQVHKYVWDPQARGT